jgi:hypothetical protein
MSYKINPVRSKHDLKSFIQLTYWLYRDDQNWVAPLRIEEKKKFRPESNAMLLHCEVELFLLYQNEKPIGRIAAFIDKLALEHWGEPVGLFGLFECIDNLEASRLLLEAARNWLCDKGMKTMRGPWSFTSQEWGVVIKGLDSPMIMAPYNFPYYRMQIESFGMEKIKDLLVYELNYSEKYKFPERILKLTDQISNRGGVSIRSVSKRNLKEDVRIILELANQSVGHHWGYVPVTDKEAHEIANSMKMIIDPDIVMIAEVDKKPIGFLIVLPDINSIIKGLDGRLFPYGFFKLLFGLKKIKNYRVWAMGIIPTYQKKAIDTLFYRRLYEILSLKDIKKIEANYVLEDNMAMNNPILKMGFHHSKTYRVYELEIG